MCVPHDISKLKLKRGILMQSKKQASFMEATGTIAYNMTNNYMFRFILQKNKNVLKEQK